MLIIDRYGMLLSDKDDLSLHVLETRYELEVRPQKNESVLKVRDLDVRVQKPITLSEMYKLDTELNVVKLGDRTTGIHLVMVPGLFGITWFCCSISVFHFTMGSLRSAD